MDKQTLLTEMFLEYWQFNVNPVIPDATGLPQPPVNSPEYFVLQFYQDKKDMALAAYPWRSATKYITLTADPTVTPGDGRYAYEITLPDDFILATGFWRDATRRHDAQNSVDIVGPLARTNLKQFTLGYISKTIDESLLDPWVCEWIKIYIAANLADIGGQTPDRKNFLMETAAQDLIRLGNKDYEMAQKDEVSSSIHQFQWY